MSKGEILYIEDNFHNRRIVRKILERQEYVLYDAEDGLEGYERLKELMPKVVLLDISLPTMDGIEIANKVKADEATRDVILIALTASAMAGDRERFLEAGCDDYLSKPFRALDLVDMVDFYMSPEFVPGESLSPGARLMQARRDADAGKPYDSADILPKPDLRPKTEPRRATPPQPKPESKPVFSSSMDKKNGSNGTNNHTPEDKAPRPRSVPDKTKTRPVIKKNLSSGISDMFDSLNPADPNRDED